jgi:hypothetical protein
MLHAERPDLFGLEKIRLCVDLGEDVDAGALARDPAGRETSVAMRVDGQGALDLLAARLMS